MAEQQHAPTFRYLNGQVCHTGFHARDPANAAAWFEKALGWNTMPAEGSEDPYHFVADAAGSWFGGIGGLGPGFENPMILYYIQVEDLAKARITIGEHGGQFMGEDVTIPGMGSFAMFTSPGGVFAAAWQNDTANTPPEWNELPAYKHKRTVGCVVGRPTPAQDPAVAAKFFTDAFGWSFQERDSPTGHMVQMFDDNGGDGGVFFAAGEGNAAVQVHILVKDVDAATKKAKDAGGELVGDVEKFGDFGLRQDIRIPTGPVVTLWQDTQ